MPTRYNAFISYSHANAQHVVEVVQKQIQAYAKPWYRKRAVEVFRDETDLAANPGVWDTIRQALDASDYLIFVASPDAVLSKWVKREIRHWFGEENALDTPDEELDAPLVEMQSGAADRFLIALVDGDLVWEDGTENIIRGQYDAHQTTALPPMLLNTFGAEPLWVDLRPFVQADDDTQVLSKSNPDFMGAIASCPVLGWRIQVDPSVSGLS